MDREHIFLGLALAAFIAVILWKESAPPPPDQASNAGPGVRGSDPTHILDSIVGASLGKSIPGGGPAYLTFNQNYGFGPPINNFLPNLSAGYYG